MKTRRLNYGLGIILAASILMSCDAGIVGNGDVQTRTKKVEDFDRLEISGNFNVFLDQSGKPGLRIEADENIMDIIKVYESGDKLEIYSEVNILRAKKKNLYISFDELEKLELTGAVEVRAEERLDFRNLKISGSGAADVNLGMKADNLSIDISGAADFDLAGEADEAVLIISGAGGFDLLDLEVERMSLEISGAAHTKVFATEELNVVISGAAMVRYKGHPEISRNVSGIGSLKRYK